MTYQGRYSEMFKTPSKLKDVPTFTTGGTNTDVLVRILDNQMEVSMMLREKISRLEEKVEHLERYVSHRSTP